MKHMTAWTALDKGYAEATASGRSYGIGVWHEIYQVCLFGSCAVDSAPTANTLLSVSARADVTGCKVPASEQQCNADAWPSSSQDVIKVCVVLSAVTDSVCKQHLHQLSLDCFCVIIVCQAMQLTLRNTVVDHCVLQIGPGQYENIYHDMPLIGLGRCGTLRHLSAGMHTIHTLHA